MANSRNKSKMAKPITKAAIPFEARGEDQRKNLQPAKPPFATGSIGNFLPKGDRT